MFKYNKIKYSLPLFSSSVSLSFPHFPFSLSLSPPPYIYPQPPACRLCSPIARGLFWFLYPTFSPSSYPSFSTFHCYPCIVIAKPSLGFITPVRKLSFLLGAADIRLLGRVTDIFSLAFYVCCTELGSFKLQRPLIYWVLSSEIFCFCCCPTVEQRYNDHHKEKVFFSSCHAFLRKIFMAAF